MADILKTSLNQDCHYPKMVSVAGGYWTGSGAVVDMLSEHLQCNVVKGEFALFSYGQFIDEIIYPIVTRETVDHIRYKENIFRFKEFNKSEFLYPARPLLRRILSTLSVNHARLCSIRSGMGGRIGVEYINACDEFIAAIDSINSSASEEAIELIKTTFHHILMLVIEHENKVETSCCVAGVFDQFIGPAYAATALDIFPELRMIYVDRDWRDQYVEVRNIINKMVKKNSAVGVRPAGEDYHDYNLSSMKYFISLRKRISEYKKFHKSKYNNQILWVDFEDVVLKSDESARKIFDFLNLDYNLWTPETSFFPAKSKVNIGKWRDCSWGSELDQIKSLLD